LHIQINFVATWALKAELGQFVSHGCTGKGNDQVRFELAFLTIDPKISIIAPWRLKEFCDKFQGRKDLLDYAAAKGIPVTVNASQTVNFVILAKQTVVYESGTVLNG
jgi:argininosuccinate synthase